MLTGKRFRLDRATMACSIVGGKRSAVTIPGGAVIKVLSGPIDRSYNWNIKVLWEGRTVEMFAADVDIRGTEIEEQSATA